MDQTYYEMSENKHHHYNEMRTSLFVDDKAIDGPQPRMTGQTAVRISSERTEHIFNND